VKIREFKRATWLLGLVCVVFPSIADAAILELNSGEIFLVPTHSQDRQMEALTPRTTRLFYNPLAAPAER
jgi:hypothetical protein